jgi:hypothetical protein
MDTEKERAVQGDGSTYRGLLYAERIVTDPPVTRNRSAASPWSTVCRRLFGATPGALRSLFAPEPPHRKVVTGVRWPVRDSKFKARDEWAGIQHCRIRHDVLHSPAWRVLGFSSRALFVDLRARLRSTNNGDISAPLSELKHVGWSSSSTLANALFELSALGFLAVTRKGGIKQGSRVPTLYRFTDMPVLEQPKIDIHAVPATFDYMKLRSVADAERHLAEHQAARLTQTKIEQLKKNPPVRNPKRSASESEAVRPFTASKIEAVCVLPLRNSKRWNAHAILMRPLRIEALQ